MCAAGIFSWTKWPHRQQVLCCTEAICFPPHPLPPLCAPHHAHTTWGRGGLPRGTRQLLQFSQHREWTLLALRVPLYCVQKATASTQFIWYWTKSNESKDLALESVILCKYLNREIILFFLALSFFNGFPSNDSSNSVNSWLFYDVLKATFLFFFKCDCQ